jgi:hypothetical protein
MTIREWLITDCKMKDPDNYLVVNFASNSIKADAVILQAVLVYRGKLENYYVLGGSPKENFEFTKIIPSNYTELGVEKKLVEERLMDIVSTNKVEYIVYNNDPWNRRLVARNNWFKFNMVLNSTPCFPVSEYEALRHWNNCILTDFGTDRAFVFNSIPNRARSLPKGRTVLENIAKDRGITLPKAYEGRELMTTAEMNAMALDKIVQDILGRTPGAERYSSQILEKTDGTERSVAGMGDAQSGGVCRNQEETGYPLPEDCNSSSSDESESSTS